MTKARSDYESYLINFKANFGDEADILPMTFEHWVKATWAQRKQERINRLSH